MDTGVQTQSSGAAVLASRQGRPPSGTGNPAGRCPSRTGSGGLTRPDWLDAPLASMLTDIVPVSRPSDRLLGCFTPPRLLLLLLSQAAGLALALGTLVHGLAVCGHGKAEDVQPFLLASWTRVLLTEVGVPERLGDGDCGLGPDSCLPGLSHHAETGGGQRPGGLSRFRGRHHSGRGPGSKVKPGCVHGPMDDAWKDRRVNAGWASLC